MTTKTYATLVNGHTYYLAEVFFPQGVEVSISEQQMTHLQEHGVDNVTIFRAGEAFSSVEQKFSFRTVEVAEITEVATEVTPSIKSSK